MGTRLVPLYQRGEWTDTTEAAKAEQEKKDGEAT